MTRTLLATLVSCSALVTAGAAEHQPLGVPGNWKPVPAFSDEFNGPEIDATTWNHQLPPWGERAWRPENVRQKDGFLTITARYHKHEHHGKQYFYTMGILQSRNTVTYGFFEARVKACDRFPGIAPAFWLYSTAGARNPEFPRVTYSEIDIFELLQGNFSAGKNKFGPELIDCNLHTRELDQNGNEFWRRPHSWPEVCKHQYSAPWDPRRDFHTYAADVTPQTITWYIDGKRVAREKNHNWHLPMVLAFTMEARPPLIRWTPDGRREPNPDGITSDGFPTHMTVDYVRTWTRRKK